MQVFMIQQRARENDEATNEQERWNAALAKPCMVSDRNLHLPSINQKYIRDLMTGLYIIIVLPEKDREIKHACPNSLNLPPWKRKTNLSSSIIYLLSKLFMTNEQWNSENEKHYVICWVHTIVKSRKFCCYSQESELLLLKQMRCCKIYIRPAVLDFLSFPTLQEGIKRTQASQARLPSTSNVS